MTSRSLILRVSSLALCLLALAFEAKAQSEQIEIECPRRDQIQLVYCLTLTKINDAPPRGGPIKHEALVEGEEIKQIVLSVVEEFDEGKRYLIPQVRFLLSDGALRVLQGHHDAIYEVVDHEGRPFDSSTRGWSHTKVSEHELRIQGRGEDRIRLDLHFRPGTIEILGFKAWFPGSSLAQAASDVREWLQCTR